MDTPPPPYRDVTLGDLLSRLAAALPDHEALVYRERPRYTFAALERQARTIARGLMAIGVEPGERVVVWATNVPEWVVLQFALAKTARPVDREPRARAGGRLPLRQAKRPPSDHPRFRDFDSSTSWRRLARSRTIPR